MGSCSSTQKKVNPERADITNISLGPIGHRRISQFGDAASNETKFTLTRALELCEMSHAVYLGGAVWSRRACSGSRTTKPLDVWSSEGG